MPHWPKSIHLFGELCVQLGDDTGHIRTESRLSIRPRQGLSAHTVQHRLKVVRAAPICLNEVVARPPLSHIRCGKLTSGLIGEYRLRCEKRFELRAHKWLRLFDRGRFQQVPDANVLRH